MCFLYHKWKKSKWHPCLRAVLDTLVTNTARVTGVIFWHTCPRAVYNKYNKWKKSVGKVSFTHGIPRPASPDLSQFFTDPSPVFRSRFRPRRMTSGWRWRPPRLSWIISGDQLETRAPPHAASVRLCIRIRRETEQSDWTLIDRRRRICTAKEAAIRCGAGQFRISIPLFSWIPIQYKKSITPPKRTLLDTAYVCNRHKKFFVVRRITEQEYVAYGFKCVKKRKLEAF